MYTTAHTTATIVRPNTISTKSWINVVDAALVAAAPHPAWVRAIKKAVVNMQKSVWYYDYATRTLVVTSATTAGVRYHATGTGCDCAAGRQSKPCWHRAAGRMLRTTADTY